MAQGLPPMDQVREWSKQDVIDWLNRMDLSACVDVFIQREIDGHALLNFSEEQLILLLTDLKLKHRLQLTKYINQCKEKDLTFKNAKKKILSTISQPKTPPPVPQKDYRWPDDDSEQSWGSDFDEDSDFETDNKHYNNSNNTENQFGELNINETKHKIANEIDLPEQPQIPWRKMKSTDLNENSETNNTRFKPPVAAKPAIKQKPVIEALNSNRISNSVPTGIPRPPSGLPTKLHRVVRPSEQPPPPPIKTQQLLDLHDDADHLPFEEYEVPLSCSSSVTSDAVSVSSHASNNAYSSSVASNSQSYVDISADESGSSSSSYGCDQPALPPRSSPQTQIAPPLPRKPIKPLELARISSEKPVLLPIRRSNENSKYKEGQLKAITGVLKNKFNTLLHADKSNKGDSSSSHSGSRSSTPEHAVSLTSLCQEQNQQSTLNRTRSQEPLGNRESGISRGHRCSLDEGASMQNRPLPPLPKENDGQPSASPVCLKPEDLFSHPWFHSVERNTAEAMLHESKQTGSYLVRQSRRAGETNPYTLSVLFEEKVFHLNIRQRSDDTFALGKEKINEKAFESVEDLIETHQTEPILLTSMGLAAGKTILLLTPSKS